MKKENSGFFTHSLKKLKSITPVQAIVLLVVIILAVAVVKFFGKQGEWRLIKVQVIGKNWNDSFVNYDGYRPPFWLTESINKGDAELGVDGDKLAEVVKIESFSRGGPENDLYLTLKIKGTWDKRTNKFIYRGKSLEVGSPISLNLNNTAVLAQVIDNRVPDKGYETKEVIIIGRVRNAEPWIISNLNLGDKMMNGKGGEVIAEILTITTEPAQSQIIFSDPSRTGTLIAERNPRLKDIVLTARLVVERHGNEWYFGGHQNIKAGNFLWIYLPQVDLRVIEIESVAESGQDENYTK